MSSFHTGGNPNAIMKIKGGSNNVADVTDYNRLKIEVDFVPGSVPSTTYISLTLGDGSSPIGNYTKGYTAPISYSGTIKGWSIAVTEASPLPSSIEVRFFRDTMTNFPPSTVISGTKPVELIGQTVNIENNLINHWDRQINANDCLGFEVVGVDGIVKKCTIILEIMRDITILPLSKKSIPAFSSLTIGDGIAPITTLTTGYSGPIPFSGKIRSFSIAVNTPLPLPASIEVEILKNNLTVYPPVTVVSGTKPIKLDGQMVNYDNSLEGFWDDTNINFNDVLGFRVLSTDGIVRKVMIVLDIERNI